MPDLQTAEKNARAAVDAYDSLDRNQRMDDAVLKERAIEIHKALSDLVEAADGEVSDDQIESARDALEQFEDPTEYDVAQHVRRACYVLRKETNAILGELEA